MSRPVLFPLPFGEGEGGIWQEPEMLRILSQPGFAGIFPGIPIPIDKRSPRLQARTVSQADGHAV
jgi:hypothetical protein